MEKIVHCSAGNGTPRRRRTPCAPDAGRLEQLHPGERWTARDGTKFLRTDRTCICFCNLTTGHMCSAREICRHYGAQDDGRDDAGQGRRSC